MGGKPRCAIGHKVSSRHGFANVVAHIYEILPHVEGAQRRDYTGVWLAKVAPGVVGDRDRAGTPNATSGYSLRRLRLRRFSKSIPVVIRTRNLRLRSMRGRDFTSYCRAEGCEL
jgi:hypothetical protein